jgi:hypothetical protein
MAAILSANITPTKSAATTDTGHGAQQNRKKGRQLRLKADLRSQDDEGTEPQGICSSHCSWSCRMDGNPAVRLRVVARTN